jgi:hypothetical protein
MLQSMFKIGITKRVVWIGLTILTLCLLGVGLWMFWFQSYTPAEVAQDLRAGLLARHAPRPVERFLEIRYGPLTNLANRQKAFLDFFNPGHIQGLQIMTSHMEESERRTNITAMAEWIAQYRNTMSLEEKLALRACLATGPGRQALQQATSQYLQQDVYYRAATAPVIEQIMSTVVYAQQP